MKKKKLKKINMALCDFVDRIYEGAGLELPKEFYSETEAPEVAVKWSICPQKPWNCFLRVVVASASKAPLEANYGFWMTSGDSSGVSVG